MPATIALEILLRMFHLETQALRQDGIWDLDRRDASVDRFGNSAPRDVRGVDVTEPMPLSTLCEAFDKRWSSNIFKDYEYFKPTNSRVFATFETPVKTGVAKTFAVYAYKSRCFQQQEKIDNPFDIAKLFVEVRTDHQSERITARREFFYVA